MHGEARDFLFGELQADRHGVEAAPRHDHAPGALDVVGRQQAERHEPLQRVVDVGVCSRDEFELERRAVDRERRRRCDRG